MITNLCSAPLASDGLLAVSGSEEDMGSLSTELESTAQVLSSLRCLPSLSYSCGCSKSVLLFFKPVRLWVFCPHFHIPVAHTAAKLPLVQGTLEPPPTPPVSQSPTTASSCFGSLSHAFHSCFNMCPQFTVMTRGRVNLRELFHPHR